MAATLCWNISVAAILYFYLPCSVSWFIFNSGAVHLCIYFKPFSNLCIYLTWWHVNCKCLCIGWTVCTTLRGRRQRQRQWQRQRQPWCGHSTVSWLQGRCYELTDQCTFARDQNSETRLIGYICIVKSFSLFLFPGYCSVLYSLQKGIWMLFSLVFLSDDDAVVMGRKHKHDLWWCFCNAQKMRCITRFSEYGEPRRGVLKISQKIVL